MKFLIVSFSVIVLAILLGGFLFSKEQSKIGEFHQVTTEEQFVFVRKYKSFKGVMLAYNLKTWRTFSWPNGFHLRIKSVDGRILLDETVDFQADVGILGRNVPGDKKVCETNWVRCINHPDWSSEKEVPVIRSFYMPTKDYGACWVSVKLLLPDKNSKLYWAPYFSNSW